MDDAHEENIEQTQQLAESFIENLLILKEQYGHMDTEFIYDVENLISEYEEFADFS
jgi:hypothetical protein